jgi:hypothetical protein
MAAAKLDIGKDEVATIRWKSGPTNPYRELPVVGRDLGEAVTRLAELSARMRSDGKSAPKVITVKLVERDPVVEIVLRLRGV